ncbi:site-specific integrase [Solirubrobacter ginsenosidimutans]|uniref:Site-specific integrase n=1 Tax=Solirubrobacter ginsenosidimutans TaxID=490573 RepID=A0A9X3S2K8_9ACTN|nr:tyrosine-type recombinase/integrase [Solirubrobacter ginsenosidimutans]MDA0161281.1 site-specific integrase [Solirubrobacter ginsenosidimutans]
MIAQIIVHVKRSYGTNEVPACDGWDASEKRAGPHADGSALVLRPHDCRRAFASEHLDNDTPIHVIQALFGNASPDTVMVYAKLYPATLIDEYRKTVGAACADFHGPDSLRAPNAAEWAEFARRVELRDMASTCARSRPASTAPAAWSASAAAPPNPNAAPHRCSRAC